MLTNSLLDPAGPVSTATRDLLFQSVGLMLVVVVPVFVLTAFVVLRYRQGNTGARYAPDWDGSRVFEIGIWLVPLAIVLALWGIVWNATHQLDPYKPLAGTGTPLVVQAVALDWQWLFIYPDENVASLNRLVFPAARPLTIEITSDTVMNSLSVPALGGQIYAMPGMRTKLNLMASDPGTFVGRNTMFSGDGFSAQTFDAEATTASDFDAFLTAARGSRETLDAQAFTTISQPTINGPARLFSSVEEGLFDTIMGAHDSMPDMAGKDAPMPSPTHAGHNP